MTTSPGKPKFISKPITFSLEISTRKLSEFWKGLENGKVYASKCRKCGSLSFPPVADCSTCLSSEPEWMEIEGEGEIETFTHIMIRPKNFAESPPYTVAVAKMKEGVKILAWVTNPEYSKLKTGAKVRLVTEKSETGATYAFTLH
ncbi:hypothetical protein A3K71_05115 [archaeon RBG_16_50_20]|nr:MAG: hypothetical protein A3K71_05115 [archaeon RBG_16_50_20]